MDDKPNKTPDPLFVKMDEVLAQVSDALVQLGRTVHEVRNALYVIAGDGAPLTGEREPPPRTRSALTRMVVNDLMSGRWHRRDGDVYGIVRQGAQRADDSKPPGQE